MSQSQPESARPLEGTTPSRLLDRIHGGYVYQRRVRGFALPYDYLRREDWTSAIETLDMTIVSWQSKLSLYT